jgi:hypothetical protein
MGKREEVRNIIIVLIIAICLVLLLNYGLRIDSTTMGIIGALMIAMIPSVLSYLKSNKINKVIKEFIIDQKEINEFIRHRKEIDNICQLIERQTNKIFGMYSEVNPILSDYVIQINESISDLIDKKYRYNLDLFDSEYFKNQLLIKINLVSKDINYVMINKETFKNINQKVITNIDLYIEKLENISDLENGKRRKKFRDETLNLAGQIANHSIDIYNKKQAYENIR